MIIRCEYCEGFFSTTYSYQRFCNRLCSSKNRKSMTLKNYESWFSFDNDVSDRYQNTYIENNGAL